MRFFPVLCLLLGLEKTIDHHCILFCSRPTGKARGFAIDHSCSRVHRGKSPGRKDPLAAVGDAARIDRAMSSAQFYPRRRLMLASETVGARTAPGPVNCHSGEHSLIFVHWAFCLLLRLRFSYLLARSRGSRLLARFRRSLLSRSGRTSFLAIVSSFGNGDCLARKHRCRQRENQQYTGGEDLFHLLGGTDLDR